MRVFEENQKFTQSWLMIVVGVSLLAPIFIMIKEWNENVDKSIEANMNVLIVLGVVCLSLIPLILIKLKTRIDNIGIHYQFFPFHMKYRVITWKEIKKVYVRKYSPINEYGGWGYKSNFFNKNRGVSFSISGNLGIQIIPKKGRKILIGTKQSEKATQAINYNLNTDYE